MTDAARTICLDLIAAMKLHADKVAFSDARQTVTYGELLRFCQRYSEVVTPGQHVGIYHRPSVAFGVACVIALINGCPIVHIDRNLPDANIKNLIGELDLQIVFAEPNDVSASFRDLTTLSLSTLTGAQLQYDPDWVGPALTGDHIIYTVSTSGTTGAPKCIPVSHRAAQLSYEWRERSLPYDDTLNVGVYIFAVWEVFRPLLHGGTVHFPSESEVFDTQAFSRFLEGRRVDEMLFVPSFVEKIIDTHTADQGVISRHLSRIILNGEPVSEAQRLKIVRAFPRARIWNLYSICETHDVSLVELTGEEEARAQGLKTVGHPMPHLEAMVLDYNGEGVTAGEPGEIFLGGDDMLGPGYVNRPEETAKRFVHKTVGGASRRLYKTGDEGFVAETGELYIIGRMAHMLKIRGHSIQTEEIRETIAQLISHLNGMPWVAKTTSGRQVFVYYYTASDAQKQRNQERWGVTLGQPKISRSLKEELSRMVPSYCIPEYFIQLDEIPINSVSGKYDFKALPAIDTYIKDRAPEAAQHTGIEKLRALCAAILQVDVDAVDISESFSHHGADSLQVVDLSASIDVEWGKRIEFGAASTFSIEALYQTICENQSQPSERVKIDPNRRGILLTGATGFLGKQVLSQLRQSASDSQVIYCLIRHNGTNAARRLENLLAELGLPGKDVIAVEGSMADPLMGLHSDDYDRLAASVDSVVHCASLVNLGLREDHLKTVVVNGGTNIIDFCGMSGSTLQFISSSAVFPEANGHYPEDCADPCALLSGYGKTKIEVEKRILESNIPHTIIRIPSLYSDQSPNEHDIYEIILSASRASAIIPKDLKFQMVDVNRVAEYVAHSAVANMAHGIVNLMNNTFIDLSNFPGSQDMMFVSANQWLERVSIKSSVRDYLKRNIWTFKATAIYGNANAEQSWRGLFGSDLSELTDTKKFIARRFSDRI